jgi:phosphoadenosine phosphosulfate reductase
MTEELQKKIERAVKLIQSAGNVAKFHGQPLEICYSGGKDSDVIWELAKMAGVEYRAIYKNTTIDPPGTIGHARAMGVEIMQPQQSFREIMEKKGMPNRWRRFCCGILKEYKVLDYAVVGVRRDESRARAERYHEPEVCRVYNKTKGIKSRQYLPILEWSAQDVAQFLTERGVKCHSLYYDEYGNFHPERRLGCMCCPLQSRNKRVQSFKEYPMMVRFYIKAAQKYLDTHPNFKITKIFNANPYDWFTSQVFCDGERQFRERFGANMFDDAIDTKAFLEQQFKIKL